MTPETNQRIIDAASVPMLFDTDFDQDIDYKYRHVCITAQNLDIESTETFDKTSGAHKFITFKEIALEMNGHELDVEVILLEEKECTMTIDSFIQALFGEHDEYPYFENKEDHKTWERLYREAVVTVLHKRFLNLTIL